MEEILRTESLTVGYHGKPVISDVTLTANAGKILTLIGPNGAGKSTILKTLIRQLAPISGRVFLKDKDMTTMSEGAIARLVSVVLTARPKVELMTCRDVVSSGRYPFTGRMGILSAHDKQIVAESMELVRVTELADRDFNAISDGQRQRVMLARAICQEPRLLIMDEPTSYLDIKHKLDFLYLLGQLVRSRGIAVILSLHELEFAQRFSDTILAVKDGAVDRSGPPEEIFTEGYIEQLYEVKHGSYNVLYGGVETQPPVGTPQVFILGGGGSGIPVYRRLQRMGVPFVTGVLNEGDTDCTVAGELASQVITVPPFEPVSAGSVDHALEVLKTCRYLVCCCDRFGPMNAENERLLTAARELDMLLGPEQLDRLTIQE